MDRVTDEEAATDPDSRRIGGIRIFIGLIQGLLLYLLFESAQHKVWPGSDHVAHAALLAVAFFAPIVLTAGLRAFSRRTLIVWTLASAVIAAALIGYEAWRNLGDPLAYNPTPSPWGLPFAMGPLAAAVLFIGNHLLEASEADRRFVAAYPHYFEPAWKHGVQGVLSVLFTGVFWGLLYLGAELFKLIHITLLADLIAKPWFAWPATGMAFAAAIHLTDVRPAVVRGVRVVALTLLAWLTPLLALLAGAFVLALPFTGLQPLWQTRAAASILLSAASMLVVLINAAYQDGQEPPPAVLRWAGRAAGVILVPLVALAAVGLWLRIQQYGLTPQRILASAWAVIAAGYAIGYIIAALRPDPWMKPLERTNVAVAWLMLTVAALLFTPIADPARLSVADQVHRLDSGKTRPDAFDFSFLHWRAQRYGREALAKLAGRKDAVGELAVRAQQQQNPWVVAPVGTAQQIAGRFTVYPVGGALPDGFINQDWSSSFLPCVQMTGKRCEAYLIDIDGDGAPEVMVKSSDTDLIAFGLGTDGRWTQIGAFNGCQIDAKALQAGQAKAIPAEPRNDLEVNGQRLRYTPQPTHQACPTAGSGATSPSHLQSTKVQPTKY